MLNEIARWGVLSITLAVIGGLLAVNLVWAMWNPPQPDYAGERLISGPRVLYVLIAIVVLVCVLYVAYHLSWTGFGRDIIDKKQSTVDWRRAKTFWDWMQLLIVPAALAAGGFWCNRIQDRTNRRTADRHERETALQVYLNQMGDLLVSNNLLNSNMDDAVRKVARALTLTVLESLSYGPNYDMKGYSRRDHKAEVLWFLHDAGLVNAVEPIVSLADANLTFANLKSVRLQSINLTLANLEDANLEECNLENSYLIATKLSRANLTNARLNGANLLGAEVTEEQLDSALRS